MDENGSWLSQIFGLLPQITRLFPKLGVGEILGANGQCLSSLVDIPRCLTQVFCSLVDDQFNIIGSSCCKAFSEIEENCLSNLFPSNLIFAPLLNNSCGQPSKGNRQVFGITVSKAALPGNQDIQMLWIHSLMVELTSLALLVVKPSLWSVTIACLNCSLLTQLFKT